MLDFETEENSSNTSQVGVKARQTNIISTIKRFKGYRCAPNLLLDKCGVITTKFLRKFFNYFDKLFQEDVFLDESVVTSDTTPVSTSRKKSTGRRNSLNKSTDRRGSLVKSNWRKSVSVMESPTSQVIYIININSNI